MNLHDVIIKELAELSRSYEDYEPASVHVKKAFPMPSMVPLGKSRKLQLGYTPDLWVARRRGRFYDLYEVWDSEGEEKAVFEILRVAFTPQVKYYSVVCINRGRGYWNKRDAADYVRGVLDNLEGPFVDFDDVSIAEVNAGTVKDERRLRNEMIRQLQFSRSKLRTAP